MQVEAMQRRAAYERDQLLARIQSDTEKAQDLLAQRTALQVGSCPHYTLPRALQLTPSFAV